jgi:Predicted transcriptional regulators
MPNILGMIDSSKPVIAARVRELRAARSLTQEQLADLARLDRHTVQNVEAAKNCTVDVLDAIAGAFNVELRELVE